MIPSCNCLGCQNMAKRLKILKKPDRTECISIESDANRYDGDNKIDQYSENCIPKSNVNVEYERNAKTSDLYQTMNIPDRFERPCTLKGYGNQWKTYHPIFHTTNSEYGWLPPNIHTVPHRYYPRSNEFSELLAKSGMYRNYSLNTLMDKSRI